MKFVRIKKAGTGLVVSTPEGLQTLEVRGSLERLLDHDAAAARSIQSVLPSKGSDNWIDLIDQWSSVRHAFKLWLV